MSSLRRCLLKILPPFAIQFIRKAMPLCRKCLKSVCRLTKPWFVKQVSSKPNSVTAHMRLGYVSYLLDQFDEAIGCYEKAIEINPHLLKAHLRLEMLIRFNGHERKEDSQGNRIFDNRTYNLDQGSRDKLLVCTRRMVEIFPDSVEANFRLANALIMALGNREEASYFFHQATKLRIAETRAKGNWGPIFVASMHRSASGFIHRSLSKGLGMPEDIGEAVPCTDWWYPDITIPMPDYALSMAPIPDSFSVGHTSGMKQNLVILNLCIDRMVVNVRDPRQGLISYVHYIRDYFRHTNNIDGLLEAHIPRDYFSLSLTDQISWQIENFYLPASIKWIQRWTDAETDTTFYPKILFTTQEKLVADPKGFFDTILDFYGFDQSLFKYPAKPSFQKNTPMRKGGVDEWRQEFTPEQIQKATQMIPDAMYQKFGWSKDVNVSKEADILVS